MATRTAAMAMGKPHPKAAALAAIAIIVVLLLAGCVDGPPRSRVDSDPPLGPLEVFTTADGSALNARAYLDDIDPLGRWIVLKTWASNMGFTDPGDCEAREPGAGCRITYVAAIDGTDYSPLGNRSEVDERDLIVSAALSSDARFVAFSTIQDDMDPRDQNGSDDSFSWSSDSGVVWLSAPVLPHGEPRSDRCQSHCGHVSATPDGASVVFTSQASDLTLGDNNAAHDVFISTGDGSSAPTLVSANPSGAPGNGESWTRRPQAVSEDGSLIVFLSEATDLVPLTMDSEIGTQVYVRDIAERETTLISMASDGRPFVGGASTPVIDPTGRWVVIPAPPQPGDPGQGAKKVIHLIDLDTSHRRVVSVPVASDVTGTTSFVPSVSRDASHISFTSDAQLAPEDDDALLDVYLWSRETDAISMVSDPRLPNALAGLATSSVLAEDTGRIAFRWEQAVEADPPWNHVSRIVYRDIHD